MPKWKVKFKKRKWGGDRWDPYRDQWGLTPKRHKFVEYFATPTSETFLNAYKSVMRSFNSTSGSGARVIAARLKKDPRVRKAIEQIIKEDEDLESMVLNGMRHRLNDPDHRNWQPTADFWAKIRGAFAPEKHVNVNLTPEQRDQEYEELLAKIRAAQAEKLPAPTDVIKEPDGV